MSEIIYSIHNFMFPFQWDIIQKGFNKSDTKEQKYSFEDRTNLKEAILFFENECWERKKLNLVDNSRFNELIYLHEFVRRVNYDFEDQTTEPLLAYFEYSLEKLVNRNYSIKILEKGDASKGWENNSKIKTITLEIESITLHIYGTGIGILAFNLYNKNDLQKSPEDILIINEYGRRIYPQFLGSDGILDTKKIFLADSISVGGIEENFNNYSNKLRFNNLFHPPEFIEKLFNSNIVFKLNDEELPSDKILITKVLDDRMFYLCWYGNTSFAQQTGRKYEDDPWWYSFIFGDKKPGISIGNSSLMKNQIEGHTYQRWSEYGTLYGMSRDSFVCLSPDKEFISKEELPPLDKHMESVYYQMAMMVLGQRATVVRFSSEITSLTDMAKMKEDTRTLEKIKDLYINYIEFRNKIYFREIGTQIQAIELYTHFQKVMRIEEEVKDLALEIQELHSYAEMVKQYQLNRIATYYLPVTVVASILGMNTFDALFEAHFNFEKINYILTIRVLLTLIVIGWSVYVYFQTKKKK